MGTHPNAMLFLTLIPDDLARKTYREIQAKHGKDQDFNKDYVVVGGDDYHLIIMESDYSEDYQLSAPEGSIVLMDMVTYGYGETITWEELERKKTALEEWAKPVCEYFKCSSSIHVGANYW